MGSVATVDRRGNKEILSPQQYFNVFGLAWNGDEIWYTAATERFLFRNEIHALAPGDSTSRVVTRIPGNASLHDISPDGRVLMARTDDRGGMAVLPPGESRERDISWLDAPHLDDISRDGRRILFTETGVGGGPEWSVYLGDTAGDSPPVPLGDGSGVALSPDAGRAIVADVTPGGLNSHLNVIPTGPGRSTRIEHPGFEYSSATCTLDGEGVVVRARERGGEWRLYVQELGGGDIRAITPEGIGGRDWALSPDGTMLAVASDERGVELYPVDGDDAPTPTDVALEGRLIAWIEGGLLLSDDPNPRALDRIFRVDPVSGEGDIWREIRPRDPTGIMNVQSFAVTPDGSSYGYRWHRALSDLYVVEGLT